MVGHTIESYLILINLTMYVESQQGTKLEVFIMGIWDDDKNMFLLF